jgi:hypothetical protein
MKRCLRMRSCIHVCRGVTLQAYIQASLRSLILSNVHNILTPPIRTTDRQTLRLPDQRHTAIL